MKPLKILSILLFFCLAFSQPVNELLLYQNGEIKSVDIVLQEDPGDVTTIPDTLSRSGHWYFGHNYLMADTLERIAAGKEIYLLRMLPRMTLDRYELVNEIIYLPDEMGNFPILEKSMHDWDGIAMMTCYRVGDDPSYGRVVWYYK